GSGLSRKIRCGAADERNRGHDVSDLAFYRFEYGIEILLIAEIEEFVTQRDDAHPGRDFDDHVRQKQRGAAEGGRVTAGAEIQNFDVAAGEKHTEFVDAVDLVRGKDVDRIGQGIFFSIF